MRIVFMGTPQFALPSLEGLVASPHEVTAVLTQPDRPVGRGRRPQAPPVKNLAGRFGIGVLQPEKVKEESCVARLTELAPDLIVVAAYGQILPRAILDIPKICCLNLHASLLPRYRGAAPINWAIIRGEIETGITIMKMDQGLDTGEIVAQEKVEILEDDDALSVSDMLSVVGARRLLETVDLAERQGRIAGWPQDESLATHAPILEKEDGRIDWRRTTEEIICLVRGTQPWPGAYTPSKNGQLKILGAELIWPDAEEKIRNADDMEPGAVALTMKSHGFAVRTSNGFLMVTRAQPAGKREMSGVDMVNGKYVQKGDRLVAPEEQTRR